jgi:CheY-like chemotaxis protein
MHRSIVVVDDNQLTGTLLTDALQELGFSVITCRSASEALAAVNLGVPLACFVDQVMPRVTGAQLVRVLRASNIPGVKAMPIIGCTGASAHELLESGANLCLKKPVKRAALAAALATVGLRSPTAAATRAS